MPRTTNAPTGAPIPAQMVGRDYLQTTLALNAAQLARAVRAGHLPPPLTLGNTRRWRKADIDKLIAA